MTLQAKDAISKGILRWPSEEAKAWTLAFVRSAPEDVNIWAVIAVGSSIREGVPSADLDLVVISEDNSNLTPPIDVDLRTYHPREVKEFLSRGHDLLGWAVRFGVAVYDKGQYWEDLRSAWLPKLQLPSAETARERADRSAKYVQELREMGDEVAARENLISWLTHLARACLIEAKIAPLSRPELPGQLRMAGAHQLASCLDRALAGDVNVAELERQLRSLGAPGEEPTPAEARVG